MKKNRIESRHLAQPYAWFARDTAKKAHKKSIEYNERRDFFEFKTSLQADINFFQNILNIKKKNNKKLLKRQFAYRTRYHQIFEHFPSGWKDFR